MGSLRVGHDWATSLSRIGGGNGNPLQCSCLENPSDGGAWWAAVCGVTQSRTRPKWLSSSSSRDIISLSKVKSGPRLTQSGMKKIFPHCPPTINWSEHRLFCLPGIFPSGNSKKNFFPLGESSYGLEEAALKPWFWASLVAQLVKNLPAVQEMQFQSLGPRSPREGNDNLLQYSCLEKSMNRGAWRATVHGVSESDTTERLTISLF